MSRITSIKELQATCDELYNYFVERLSQVTEIEPINEAYFTGICLHIVKTKYRDNCIKIRKYYDGVIHFWADGWNGLEIGTYSDNNAIEISRNSNSVKGKGYTNKNGHKTSDQKKESNSFRFKSKTRNLIQRLLIVS